MMVELFPVPPPVRDQALAIGVTSYNGGGYVGRHADRDAMQDVGVLASAVEKSVEELVGAVSA